MHLTPKGGNSLAKSITHSQIWIPGVSAGIYILMAWTFPGELLGSPARKLGRQAAAVATIPRAGGWPMAERKAANGWGAPKFICRGHEDVVWRGGQWIREGSIVDRFSHRLSSSPVVASCR